MHDQPITPFRRAMDAAQLHRPSPSPLPHHTVDKWEVLKELAVARERFSLSDRDLAVLQALLSFHPGTKLDDPKKLIVFPSNATLCERLNGMPCSTMRRHLARLIEAGVISRCDSPNGKRYRRREGQAFGFDLSPLVFRSQQIHREAVKIRAEHCRIKLLREQISLLRRDILEFLREDDNAHLSDIAEMARKMSRRRLTVPQLESLHGLLLETVDKRRETVDIPHVPSTNDTQNEQHQYNTNKKNPDSDHIHGPVEDITLTEVLTTCSQVHDFALDPITDWTGFVRTVEEMRPMMGICDSAWHQAIEYMGHVAAALTLAGILQRFHQIRVPGAYLRQLAVKATKGTFSPIGMIRNLSTTKVHSCEHDSIWEIKTQIWRLPF